MTRHERHEKRRRWKKKCLLAPLLERQKATPHVKSEPTTADTGPIVKTCGCSKSYTALAWALLPFKGLIEPDDGVWAELRNCSGCGSTIALRVRILNVLAIVPVAA